MPRLIDDPEFMARKEAFAGGNVGVERGENDEDPPELSFRIAEVLEQEPIFYRENPNGTQEHGVGVLVEKDGYYFAALTEVHFREGRHTLFHSVANRTTQDREEAGEIYEEFIEPCREHEENYWGRRA